MVGEGPGDRHALAFAAGHGRRLVVGAGRRARAVRAARWRAGFLTARLRCVPNIATSMFSRAVSRGIRLWSWKMRPIVNRR